MTELSYTTKNVELVQKFISETRKRISEITFTRKASSELEDLMLEYDIDEEDIQNAISNLTTENYYRGVDPSGSSDFDVCAFRVFIGSDNIEIYLKYGLKVKGLQVLIFSNHIPNFTMSQPFKN